MERGSVLGWIAAAVAGAGALGVSTVWLAASADVVAIGGAAVWGVAASAAAWRRHRIERLPLQVAPIAALGSSLCGPTLTVRGWLGRGRRIESLAVEARLEGRPVAVLHANGPLVGCFQVMIELGEATGPLEVAIEAQSGGTRWSVEERFPLDAQRAGRFAPGIARVNGRLNWVRQEWSQLRS